MLRTARFLAMAGALSAVSGTCVQSQPVSATHAIPGSIKPSAASPSIHPESEHWSFRPIHRPQVPRVILTTWPRNPIDRFILARLEAEKITPSPEADRRTLIRRLSLDLVGLPPSMREVEEFVADQSPNAYEKVVDRLLSSPHYGEHWARRWLDLARYADTNGYEKDQPRVMWKYRDWVIDALNRDMPFDRFTIEQIAGDMLQNASVDQRIATGFHRNTMLNYEGGADQEEYRWEAIHDRVATTGIVFLGLTTGCARCHDHKYDPISQKDYYRLAAFFNNSDDLEIELSPPAVIHKRDEVRAEITALAKQIRDSPKDKHKAEWQTHLNTLYASEPIVLTAMVMSDRKQPRSTHILIRGDFQKEGETVEPGVLEWVHSLPAGIKADRLALARWLVSGQNPLVTRVTVNRMWQSFFGRGLAATSDDFGYRGEEPSHPELLDWLASEFQNPSLAHDPAAGTWTIKRMHRLIVTSATYRQSSQVSSELIRRDPENRLLARAPRCRVEAETIRDIALSVSGLLTSTIGGPSVFPPQPDGVTSESVGALVWNTSTGPDRYRRGLYTFLKRTAPYPALILFDAPTSETSCPRRNRSDTPLQALTTLNDAAFVEAAQALAARLMKENHGSTEDRIRFAFRLCVAREPTALELKPIKVLFLSQLARMRSEPKRAADIALQDPKSIRVDQDVQMLAAWTIVSRVLLNMDETMTKE